MFKVCILAAGTGTRNLTSKHSHKSLLNLGGRAAISLIMDAFPYKTEFVIALGHNSKYVKDYLEVAEDKRNIQYVNVCNYDKKGSGPGLSLLSCKKYLQTPFIFTSCDTIIKEKIKNFKNDWIGVSEVNDPLDYLSVTHNNSYVQKLYDKKTKSSFNKNQKTFSAFIGIAGIYHYKIFWESLSGNKNLIRNERQVSNGLEGLLGKKLYLKKLTWIDIGNEEKYINSLNQFPIKVLPKLEESIFFEKNKVIKFFRDKNKTTLRFKRGQILHKVIPKKLGQKNNFLFYEFEKGKLLSEILNEKRFEEFLNFSLNSIWENVSLNKNQKKSFILECDNFYKEKTFERVNNFFRLTKTKDRKVLINGEKVDSVISALSQIEWNKFSELAKPVIFHGDPQPENILVKNSNFIFLDWRETFGRKLQFGDIYYDLAKIYHALIVSGKVIRKNEYETKGSDIITINFFLRENLIRFLKVFENFVHENNFDLKHIRILSSLIYLNIAPLHHDPYNKFVFNFGRYLLNKSLNNLWPY